MPKEKDRIWLSYSGIEGLNRCPRCFWLRYKKGIYQPEGIVSRLANRFDGVMKKYFDLYRQKGELPPMVEGKIEGKLENPFQEVYFYHCPQGNFKGKYGFYGKLDECLVTSDNKYTPVDFKTSSTDPRGKATLPAYQNQLDAYAFLLEVNKKKTTGIGHLIYVFPDIGEELHNGFPMVIHVVTLKTNPQNAKTNLIRAIQVLEGPMPEPSVNCPFCKWYDKMKEVL